ncbi:hypothetical protein EV363DRAFT_1095102, partial [Boletus edulis]
MRLNGQVVCGRFDETVYRCLVSPTVIPIGASNSGAPTAVIQAEYCGTCFTADVSVEIDHIDCDVIVGREWIAFFHLVVNDPRSGSGQAVDCDSPRYEVLLSNHPPNAGRVSAAVGGEHSVHPVTPGDSQRSFSIQSLERALHLDDPPSQEWIIFHSDHFFTGMCARARDDDAMFACREVRRGFHGCTDLVTVLLGLVLLPDLRYSTERLSMIARAVGLVTSGAGVERRKLVSMLTEFKNVCTEEPHDVVPSLLFSKFERLDRCSLLSIGFAHGVILVGSRDVMCDHLTSHLINGECAESSGTNYPHCVAVVEEYMKGLMSRDK